ncbi:hypothetical protein H0H92_011125 [Tricholoma furcatifolium]|nr:hypothetical protein H0H92_011125 [Tricholoma furcatifolium]
MSSTKRKAGDSSATASKKARTAQEKAIESVSDILHNPKGFILPDGDVEVRKVLVDLAQYARGLEDQLEAQKPKEKSPEQLQAEADKLRAAVRSSIRKQMTWKPSCKTGSARFVFDGVCADAAVFGAFLGLDGPPKWKTKKIPKDDFEDLVGDLRVSIRQGFFLLNLRYSSYHIYRR